MQILLSSCVLQRNMNFDASMHFPIKINTVLDSVSYKGQTTEKLS